MTTLRFDLVIRLWKFEFSAFYNRSLQQFQIAFGRRFFDGSTEYKIAFFVVKWRGKDLLTFWKKGKAIDLREYLADRRIKNSKLPGLLSAEEKLRKLGF